MDWPPASKPADPLLLMGGALLMMALAFCLAWGILEIACRWDLFGPCVGGRWG